MFPCGRVPGSPPGARFLFPCCWLLQPPRVGRARRAVFGPSGAIYRGSPEEGLYARPRANVGHSRGRAAGRRVESRGGESGPWRVGGQGKILRARADCAHDRLSQAGMGDRGGEWTQPRGSGFCSPFFSASALAAFLKVAFTCLIGGMSMPLPARSSAMVRICSLG